MTGGISLRKHIWTHMEGGISLKEAYMVGGISLKEAHIARLISTKREFFSFFVGGGDFHIWEG